MLWCRGALFFGPSFKVTRNKLTFRDNLPSLLAGAQTTERKLDKKFREWLMECHTLDRTIRYELLLPEVEQVRYSGTVVSCLAMVTLLQAFLLCSMVQQAMLWAFSSNSTASCCMQCLQPCSCLHGLPC
jgi:hypothetical protein